MGEQDAKKPSAAVVARLMEENARLKKRLAQHAASPPRSPPPEQRSGSTKVLATEAGANDDTDTGATNVAAAEGDAPPILVPLRAKTVT